MSEIEMYAIHDNHDSPTGTMFQRADEAREFAAKYGLMAIAYTYEYQDSELLYDGRPGKNPDGTDAEPDEDDDSLTVAEFVDSLPPEMFGDTKS
jgi:hypothetical protein